MIVRCKRDRMGVIQKYFYMDKRGFVEQQTYNVYNVYKVSIKGRRVSNM